jgi:hypothetical protein
VNGIAQIVSEIVFRRKLQWGARFLRPAPTHFKMLNRYSVTSCSALLGTYHLILRGVDHLSADSPDTLNRGLSMATLGRLCKFYPTVSQF